MKNGFPLNGGPNSLLLQSIIGKDIIITKGKKIMENRDQQKLFLLDGMALVYRAYFALIRNPRVTTKGFNTSALFGYTNTILSILNVHKPTHIAVAFDTPEPTQRHIEYPEYKAQRDAMPEDLILSLPHIFQLTEAFNIPILRYPGYEADDVIGTLVKQAETKNFLTYMVTPDKDYAQLVSGKTFMFKPGRFGDEAEILGAPEILEKWSIEKVEQVIDILGLWGDSSDNIPGIPGVGEKTAKALIAKFGSVEKLIANTSQLKGKQKENVETYAEQGLLSKRLVTIDCNVPVAVEIESFVTRDLDEEKLLSLLRTFEFKTLEKRIFGEAAPPLPIKPTQQNDQLELDFSNTPTTPLPPEANDTPQEGVEHVPHKTIADFSHNYRLVDSSDARKELIGLLEKQSKFCFDTETTGLDPKTVRLVGIAFSMKPREGYYVPFPEDPEQCRLVLSEFSTLFQNSQIEKIGHNLKYDIAVLMWHGVEVKDPLFDTLLAHYLIDPEGRHKMDLLAKEYFNYEPIPISDLIGEKKGEQISMEEVAIEKVVEYAAEDADITFQLRNKLKPLLKEKNGTAVFQDIEIPLIRVLITMENNGITLDKKGLQEFSLELGKRTNELQDLIYGNAGVEFNIDSPKQLGEILFDRLALDPKAKRTSKSKQYSTSEQILSRLAAKHKIVQDVLEYRSLKKLKSTYVDTLPEAVFPNSGRIHTTYNQAVTATGRIQSQDPNLQNIPIKTEKGREIRKAFIPRSKDFLLLAADYSQIELRIIAAMSKDEAMMEAFRNDVDIHTATASKIFDVHLGLVSEDMRRKSKMVNFGIIYGISPFGLSQRLNIPRKEAKFIIDQYFIQYPKVKEYMDATILFAREKGYVETIKGRRRYIRDINSRNKMLSSGAERNAINAPIQGSAADMIKVAMTNIHKELEDKQYQSKMLIQVHDELVFDLFREEREQVIPMIKEKMETAIPLEVPVVVEIGLGKNWLEAH